MFIFNSLQKQLLEKHAGNYIRGKFISAAIIPFILGLITSGIFVLIANQFNFTKILRLTYLYELSFLYLHIFIILAHYLFFSRIRQG